ncbi:MAG: PEP-CTERM system TPR-repeat protein PrsT [Ectothiorhodospiraceae bacterium]|nr:PEP-CTERM system TPR-repeat protein PrsT [Ectothiorhodospiraceae bacterium]
MMEIQFLHTGRRNHLVPLQAILLGVFVLLVACTSITPDEYLKKAELNIENGEYKTAIINLKNVLQQDSKNTQARFLLGTSYLKLGDGVSAEKELKTAQRLGIQPEDIIASLGEAYMLQNSPKKLLENLTLNETFPNQLRAEIMVLRAQAKMMLRDIDGAEKLLDQALLEVPNFMQAILARIRLAIAQRNLLASQKLIDTVLNINPNNVEGLLLAGETSRLDGRFEAAKASYKKAIALEPNNIRALLGAAGASVALEDYDSAMAHTKKILGIASSHPLANYIQAVVLYKQDKTDEAEQGLLNVIQVAPEHAPANQMLGAIYFADKRYEQARVSLEKAVRRLPGNLAVIKLLSATWLKLNDPASAIKLLEKVLPAHESNSQLLALLGSAYMQDKKAAKGTEFLERAVAQSPGNAAIQTQLALGHMATGNNADAVNVLETAVQLGKDVFQADILLVLAHMRSKEYEKALEKIALLEQKIPNSAVPFNLKGAAYLGNGDEKKARINFEKALSIKPDFAPAAINLAELDMKKGDYASAKSQFDIILKEEKSNIQVLLTLAKIESRQGNRAKSEEWLDQAWEKNVGGLQVGALLVRYWLERRNFPKSMDIAKKMVFDHPNDFAALRSLGMVQLASGNSSEATQTFGRLAEYFPEVAMAQFLLGNAYVKNNDIDAAKRHFKKSLSLDSNFLPAQLTFAQLAIQNGDAKTALQIAKKVQKQRPKSGAGFQLEGNVYVFTKKPAAAAKAYAKGYKIEPSGSLAVKHYQAQRANKAKKADTSLLRQWLKQKPNDVLVKIVLAQAYTESDNKQKAIKQYTDILVLNPINVAALNNLAWLYYEMGRKDALEYGKKALDLAPTNPAINDTYGWLLVQEGEFKKGLTYLQEANDKAPNVAEIQYHYAVALEKNGEKAKAKAELESLFKKHDDFPGAAKAKALMARLR